MIAQYKRDGIPLEKLPPDVNPNEDHLVAAGWNIDCALHHEEIHPELNDLVPQEEKNKQSTASVVDARLIVRPGRTDDPEFREANLKDLRGESNAVASLSEPDRENLLARLFAARVK
jgi:hypothetical protein